MAPRTRKLLSWIPISISVLCCALLFNYAYVEQKSHEAAHRQADVYHSLLYGSGLPMIILDKDGKITEWNLPAEEMFGWKAAEVTGKQPSFMMADPTLWEKHCSRLTAISAGEKLHEMHIITGDVLTKSGKTLRVEIVARVVKNGHGPFFVAIFSLPENTHIHSSIIDAKSPK